MSKTQNWKAFGSKYLKAENVASNTDQYIITKVDSQEEEEKETLILTVEREGISKLFGCNVTNEQAVKAKCPDNPMQALGKIVGFNKVQVDLPGSIPKKQVDGLRIFFVEAIPEVTISVEELVKPELTEDSTEDSGIAEDNTM